MGLQWGSEWQQCYVEALLERDPLNLAPRVEIAENNLASDSERVGPAGRVFGVSPDFEIISPSQREGAGGWGSSVWPRPNER